jgi:hypothetical protein
MVAGARGARRAHRPFAYRDAAGLRLTGIQRALEARFYPNSAAAIAFAGTPGGVWLGRHRGRRLDRELAFVTRLAWKTANTRVLRARIAKCMPETRAVLYALKAHGLVVVRTQVVY